MRIVALLAAYNEERFMAGCIEHYARHGVDVYLIDNGSTDRTVAIAEQYLMRGVIGIEHIPRDGVHRWKTILTRKEELAATLDADWFMHADPDEIRLPHEPAITLAEALERVDGEGYNAVNFMEFTFVPVREAPNHDHPNYQATMRWYYPFSPRFPHQVKAWKRQPEQVDLASSAGHIVRFPGLHIFPRSFPMRHYLFLSPEHALKKYAARRHEQSALQAGWHGWRAAIPTGLVIELPSKAELREYKSDQELDSSDARHHHYLEEAVQAHPPANPAQPDTRPEIIIVVDVQNWAHDNKTINLQRVLNSDYRIVRKYLADVTANDLDRADLIQIYRWTQLARLPQLEAAISRNFHKLLLGICSHTSLEGRLREPGLAALNKAAAVFVNSRLLYDEYAILINRPTFYTPNGVATSFFCPAAAAHRQGPLRAGWAGSLTNHDRGQRGYDEVIVPGVGMTRDAELVTAVREDNWRSAEGMREFYHSLDVYVCASRNEGTPNPCLEAAACGVPIVSTRVGNMPELIENGVNGFLIAPTASELAAKLAYLRDFPVKRLEMGRAIRASILGWDWQVQALNYHRMYQAVLHPSAAPLPAPETRELQELQARVARLEEQLSSIRHIAEVASREVEAVHNSRPWRLATRYWRWRDWLKQKLGLTPKPGAAP